MSTAVAVTIRETPNALTLEVAHTDPARRTVFAEPILRTENIQGSIIPGFSKSHRILLFLKVEQPGAAFKQWLKDQIPFIASADEVLAFNNLFKSTRLRRKREGTVKATWMGLSLSRKLMLALNPETSKFTDKGAIHATCCSH